METICINSANSKTSEPQRLVRTLDCKIDLKRSDYCVKLSNFSFYYT